MAGWSNNRKEHWDIMASGAISWIVGSVHLQHCRWLRMIFLYISKLKFTRWREIFPTWICKGIIILWKVWWSSGGSLQVMMTSSYVILTAPVCPCPSLQPTIRYNYQSSYESNSTNVSQVIYNAPKDRSPVNFSLGSECIYTSMTIGSPRASVSLSLLTNKYIPIFIFSDLFLQVIATYETKEDIIKRRKLALEIFTPLIGSVALLICGIHLYRYRAAVNARRSLEKQMYFSVNPYWT